MFCPSWEKVFLLLGVLTIVGMSPAKDVDAPWSLKAATYNIHGGVGADGVLDLSRIARVLKAGTPDVVGLNEVYNYFAGTSQDKELANEMGPGWTAVFGKTINKPLAQYGNAIITRLPVISSESWLLDDYPSQERRGLLRVSVRKDGRIVHVFCTHMGLNGVMRAQAAEQVVAIMQDYSDADCVLLGDFNETIPAAGLDTIRAGGFTDAWATFGLSAGKTFPSRPTLRRLDYIWLSNDLAAESCYVATHADARLASDHLPVFALILKSAQIEKPATDGDSIEVYQPVATKAFVLDNFQKVAGAETPPWWRRVGSRIRGNEEAAGFGGVAIAGEEHFWRQKSGGEMLFERKISAEEVDPGKPVFLGTRVQVVSPGEGWTISLGADGMRIRHEPDGLPYLEIVSDNQVLSTASLTGANVDPYSWNGYVLKLTSRPENGRLEVFINGRSIGSANTGAKVDLSDDHSITLKTDGSKTGACEIFADDFIVWQGSIEPPENAIDGNSAPLEAIQVFPHRIIRKTDSREKVWWLDLW